MAHPPCKYAIFRGLCPFNYAHLYSAISDALGGISVDVSSIGSDLGRTGPLSYSTLSTAKSVNDLAEAGAKLYQPQTFPVDPIDVPPDAAWYARVHQDFLNQSAAAGYPQGQNDVIAGGPFDAMGTGQPPVGGVRLDKAAELVGSLGAITGAVYDTKSGRLVLVGEKSSTLPQMRLDDLAVALRAAYSSDPHEPSMTIDPDVRNPMGPTMNVIFFANTRNTHFGSVMFEADRVMKAYSVGKDNLTKAPVQSDIAGYYNVLQLGSSGSNTRYNPHLWSRFWLVPDRIVLSISPDGRSLGFGQTKIRVKTETMRLAGGKLVPAGGDKNDSAEYFAQHFTDHYDEFVKENPIYGELKRLAQVAAVAKWMKEARIPVDFRWIDSILSEPYQTPQTTPSVTNTQSHAWKAGNVTHTETQRVFGGTDLAIPLVFRKDSKRVQEFETTVLKALNSASNPDSFEVAVNGRKLQGISITTTQMPGYGSFLTAQTDLSAGISAGTMLPLTRCYTSFHNAPTEFGRSWTLDIPRLYLQTNSPKGKAQFIGVEGIANTQVQDQLFQLVDNFRLVNLRFTEHFIDQEWRRIGFRGPGTSGIYRGLYPNRDGTYSLVYTNGDQMRFNQQGQLIETAMNGRLTRNVYDKPGGHLVEISSGNAEKATAWIRLHYDSRGRIDSGQTSTGGQVQYAYDEIGDLTAVTGKDYSLGYGYDDDHILTSVSRDGVVLFKNQYDAVGRLIRQLDGQGKTISERRLEEERGGATRITTVVNGKSSSATYDNRMRLLTTTDATGGSASYSYFEHGELRKVERVNSEGTKQITEVSADRRELRVIDVRKIKREVNYDISRLPTQMSINGEVRVRYLYDAAGKLAMLDYGNSREHFEYDSSGRLVSRAIEPIQTVPHNVGWTGVQKLIYRYDSKGDLAIAGPGLPASLIAGQAGSPVALRAGSREIGAATRSNGEPSEIRGPEGAVASFVYGQNGAIQALHIRKNGSSAECLFHDGQIAEVKSFADGRTQFHRNAGGKLVGVTDPYGTTARYVYDGSWRLARIIPAVGPQTSFAYDESGRVAQIKD